MTVRFRNAPRSWSVDISRECPRGAVALGGGGPCPRVGKFPTFGPHPLVSRVGHERVARGVTTQTVVARTRIVLAAGAEPDCIASGWRQDRHNSGTVHLTPGGAINYGGFSRLRPG